MKSRSILILLLCLCLVPFYAPAEENTVTLVDGEGGEYPLTVSYVDNYGLKVDEAG